MSNQTLTARIEIALENFRDQSIGAAEFAQIIRANGTALEAMPYALIREIESIAMCVEVTGWQEEDGFLPDLSLILRRMEDWLAKLPLNA